jgi:hypothetical protein
MLVSQRLGQLLGRLADDFEAPDEGAFAGLVGPEGLLVEVL